MRCILFLLTLFLSAATAAGQASKQKRPIKRVSTSHIPASAANEDGPPFKTRCPGMFKEVGQVIRKGVCDEFIVAKNWTPAIAECNFWWGEHEYNSNADFPNSQVKLLRIHLLDVASFTLPTSTDTCVYGVANGNMRPHVLAIHLRNAKGETSISQPFRHKKSSKRSSK